MCYDICIIIHKKSAAVEILCVKNPNVSVFSDRVEPLFMPSKNMLLTNKSRKKNTKKVAIARHPSCFVKILMQKYTKTLKNNTKIYSNNGYYDFVACNIDGVT